MMNLLLKSLHEATNSWGWRMVLRLWEIIIPAPSFNVIGTDPELSMLHDNCKVRRILGLGLKFIPNSDVTSHTLWACSQQFVRKCAWRAFFAKTPVQRVRNFSAWDTLGNNLLNRVRNSQVKKNLPPKNNIPDVVSHFSVHVRGLISATISELPIAKNRAELEHCNFDCQDRQWVDFLKNHPKFIIKPADKNLGLTVMHRSFYLQLVQQHLLDSNSYASLTQLEMISRIHIAFEELEACLLSVTAYLPKSLLHFLYGDFTAFTTENWEKFVPNFYILPKIHKNPIQGRPIVAAHSSIHHRASWFLSIIFNRILRDSTLVPWVLEDSTSYVREIEDTVVQPEDLLVSVDVVALYPSIDRNHCLRKISEWLLSSSTLDQLPWLLPTIARLCCKLLAWVFEFVPVKFGAQLYTQEQGIPMGYALSPPVAQLYLHIGIESWLIPKYKEVRLYRRYIDDIHFLWHGIANDRDRFHQFMHLWNSSLPNIKTTQESSNSKSVFLDLHIYKDIDNGRTVLRTMPFVKPANKFLYLPFYSQHAPSSLKSFVTGELTRLARHSSQELVFWKFAMSFYRQLRLRGYPRRYLLGWFSSFRYEQVHELALRAPVQKEAGIWRSTDKEFPLVFKLPYTFVDKKLQIARRLRSIWTRMTEDSTLERYIPRPIICWSRCTNLGQLLLSAAWSDDASSENDMRTDDQARGSKRARA